MRTQAIACVLGAPLLAVLLQGGVQKPPDDVPAVGSERVRVDRNKLREDMQGVWRLVAMHAPSLYPQARKDVGFCLIAGSCLSLELHMGWMSDTESIAAKSFQSGTHTFDIDDEGHLKISTLIGSFINRAGELQFESPGSARTYEIQLIANQLTLTRSDGQTLQFERMRDLGPDRDFFGRPRKDRAKTDASKDADKKDEGKKEDAKN